MIAVGSRAVTSAGLEVAFDRVQQLSFGDAVVAIVDDAALAHHLRAEALLVSSAAPPPQLRDRERTLRGRSVDTRHEFTSAQEDGTDFVVIGRFPFRHETSLDFLLETANSTIDPTDPEQLVWFAPVEPGGPLPTGVSRVVVAVSFTDLPTLSDDLTAIDTELRRRWRADSKLASYSLQIFTGNHGTPGGMT